MMILLLYVARLFLIHVLVWYTTLLAPCVGLELIQSDGVSWVLVFNKMSFLFGKFIVVALFFSVFSLFLSLHNRGELSTLMSLRPSLKRCAYGVAACALCIGILDVMCVAPRGCAFLADLLTQQSEVKLGSNAWDMRPRKTGYVLLSQSKGMMRVVCVNQHFFFKRYMQSSDYRIQDHSVYLNNALVWDGMGAEPGCRTVVLADVLKPCPIRHGHYLTASLPSILTTLWTTKEYTPFIKVRLVFWATHVLWCVSVPCMALSVVLTSVWTRRALYMAMVRWGMVFVVLFLMREWFVVSALTNDFLVAMGDVLCAPTVCALVAWVKYNRFCHLWVVRPR